MFDMINELSEEGSPQMKLIHEEKKALKLEFCERCATVDNAAVIFAECSRDRMFENMLRSGFRPL